MRRIIGSRSTYHMLSIQKLIQKLMYGGPPDPDLDRDEGSEGSKMAAKFSTSQAKRRFRPGHELGLLHDPPALDQF